MEKKEGGSGRDEGAGGGEKETERKSPRSSRILPLSKFNKNKQEF